jgi:hypothetical protein
MSYRSSPLAHVRTHVDVSLLTSSDRACLRLLERSRICTATQLANLIYPSIRTALRRTRKLWLNRLITRESLPAERGGIPVAYRLSESGRRRLHLSPYRSPGLVTIRHALDGVELVASLVRHDPGLVQLWRSESQIPELDGVKPDQLVVIDTGVASAWILVEVDESTERPPVIRERLNAYAKLFEEHRVGWHLLWVVNSPERLARLRQIAGPMKLAALADRCWGVPIGEVSDVGASAQVLAVGASLPPRPLRAIATDSKMRRTEYPVGSPAWMRLLANGGIEDMSGLWNGVERKMAVSAQAVEPKTEMKAPVVEEPMADELPVASTSRANFPETVTPDRTAVPAEANADLRLMHGGELVKLILDADGEGRRAARAIELLAERGNSYFLFDELERLGRSGVSDQQLRGLRIVRNLRPPADDSYRQLARALLMQMVNQRNEPAVVMAALDALAVRGPRAEGSS